jgi:hypothetical protein
MNQANGNFNPFDPTGALKNLRDESMDAWAKMMTELVNTEAYAESTGAALDAWLSSSGPFRKLLEATMVHTLNNLQLPTRDDVITLAGRLTNIEMRLDDLDAKVDELLREIRAASGGRKQRVASQEPAS